MSRRKVTNVQPNQPPPYILSTVIPSPSSSEELERQNQMKYQNSANILFPPRKLPVLQKLTDEQAYIADTFVALEQGYKRSIWAKLSQSQPSELLLPSLAQSCLHTERGETSTEWDMNDAHNISPSHAYKLGTLLLDTQDLIPKGNLPIVFGSSAGSEEYFTRTLLRDSIICLACMQNIPQSKSASSVSDRAISSILRRVSLNEHREASGNRRQLDGNLTPVLSDLEEHLSTGHDTDGFGLDDGDNAEKEPDRYEDYF